MMTLQKVYKYNNIVMNCTCTYNLWVIKTYITEKNCYWSSTKQCCSKNSVVCPIIEMKYYIFEHNMYLIILWLTIV